MQLKQNEFTALRVVGIKGGVRVPLPEAATVQWAPGDLTVLTVEDPEAATTMLVSVGKLGTTTLKVIVGLNGKSYVKVAEVEVVAGEPVPEPIDDVAILFGDE